MSSAVVTCRGEWLRVLALFTALTLLLTWPAVRTPSSRIIGGTDGGDLFLSLWTVWWPGFAVLHGHRLFFTDMLFAPYGASLVLHDSPVLLSLLAIPLQLWSVILAYNAIVWLTFVLSGVATYGLARECTGNRAGAVIAGVLYAFASYRFAHLPMHLGLLATFGLPAVMWAAVRAWRPAHGGRRAAVLLTLALSLHLFVNHTYYIYGLLFAATFAAWLAAVERRPPAEVARRVLVPLTVAIVVGLAMFSLAVRHGALAGHLTFSHGLRIFNGASLREYVTPSMRHPLGRAVPLFAGGPAPDAGERTVFLGVIPLVLIGLGWRSIVRSRTGRFFAAFGMLALILSLEPVFRDAVLAARWLFGSVWLIHNLRVPTRFSVLVVLTVAVLAAHGVAAVQQWLTTARRRTVAVIVLGGLVLAEHAAGAVPLTALPVPAPYERLGREAGRFILLRLPLGWDSAGPAGVFDSRDLYYQTIHGKRLIGGYLSRVPADLLTKLAHEPVIAYLLGVQGDPRAAAPDPSMAAAAMELAARWDVRFVAIHKTPPAEHLRDVFFSAPHLRSLAQTLFTLEPWDEDDSVSIYRIASRTPSRDDAPERRTRLGARAGTAAE
jgi:hypothetical protein